MIARTVFVAALLAGVATVSAQDDPHAGHKMTGMAGPAAAEFAAANDKMMAGMAVQPTGDTDRDFAAMMIPHHEGAIAMAEVQLRHGKDPAMRQLAEEIIAAQRREIEELKGFLGKTP